jgi:hypothetical protein
MKKRVSLLIAFVILLCLVGWASYGQQGKSQTVWEYKFTGRATATGEQELNDLGAQGWELVSVDNDGTRFYLKRKK